MAFNGNLSEFGVVALLQLPGTNHLSGKLVLERDTSTAEFFYNKGKLIHAKLGDTTGKDVLIEVIDWTEGDFTFDSSATSEEISIKQDLQNTLMWALKERDEKKKLEEEQAEKERVQQLAAAAAKAADAAAALAAAEADLPDPVKIPESVMGGSSTIQIAYIVNSKGQVVAGTEADPDFIEKVKPILSAVLSFIRDYPERSVGKTFIEDSEYTLALSALSKKLTAVIFVPHGIRLGVLSIELGKFVKALQSSGLEMLND
jgi:hypothetical protein